MRLIDADKLDDVVIILNQKGWAITRNEYKRIDGILFEFPTVDPVKHGRWRKKWFALARTEIAYCSVCSKGTVWAFAYCPNCGAMMDEEDDHDDHL